MQESCFNLGGGWYLKVYVVSEEQPATFKIAREDGKFYEIVMVDILGYPVPVIIEENGAFPCGQTCVIYRQVNGVIEVLARKVLGLNGFTLELMSSSISKGEIIEVGEGQGSCIQSNLKRIMGRIQVAALEADETFEKHEETFWMPLFDFVKVSEDAKSIAAAFKLFGELFEEAMRAKA
ncbi:MAG: hypothetical protein ACM3KR_03150 [Deltaproteobacteria bacterium]